MKCGGYGVPTSSNKEVAATVTPGARLLRCSAASARSSLAQAGTWFLRRVLKPLAKTASLGTATESDTGHKSAFPAIAAACVPAMSCTTDPSLFAWLVDSVTIETVTPAGESSDETPAGPPIVTQGWRRIGTRSLSCTQVWTHHRSL